MILEGYWIAAASLTAMAVACGLAIDHYRRENRALAAELLLHAEKASQVAEGDARYHLLFAHAPMGCVVWEPGFKIIEWNRQAEKIFGWRREEMLGRSLLTALVPIYARDQVIRGATALFADGMTHHMTLPHGTKDGKNITCEWDHSVMRDETGAPVRVVSLCVNVTAERGLRLENALFRSIMDLTDDPAVLIFELTRGDTVVHASDSACRRLGRSREELIGKPLVFGCSASEVQACRVTLMEKKSLTVEETYRQPDGREIPLELTLNLIEHDGQNYVVCYLRDITNRKADEARLRELEIKAAIREHEKRYREVFENTSDALFILAGIGSELVFESVNPAAEEAFGMPLATLKGMSLGSIVSGALGDEFGESIKRNFGHYLRCLDTGEAVDYEDNLDLLPSGANDVRHFHVQLIPLVGEDKVQRIVGVGRDITPRKRYEAELLARARLEEVMSRYFATAPGFFLVLKHETGGKWSLLFASPGIRETHGVEADAVVASLTAFIEVVHPEDRKRLLRQLEMSECDQTPCAMEYRVLHPSKGERWIEFRAMPQRDEDGTTVWHGFMHDVTERKHLERTLAVREQQISSVAEAVPGFLFTIRVEADGRTSFPYASSGVEALFGLKPEAIREDAWVLRERYHPEDRVRLLALMDETKQTLAPFRIEIRIRHPEAGMRWIEIRSTPKAQEDGAVEWHGLMVDVSERAEARQRLELMDWAINQCADTMFLVDEELKFVYVNDAACRALGYEKQELLGLTPMDIDPEVTVERCRKNFQRALTKEAVLIKTLHRHRGGRLFPVEIRLDAADYRGKKFFVAVARDVSEQRRMEEALAQREREFREELSRRAQYQRTLLDNFPFFVWLKDEESRLLAANLEYARVAKVASTLELEGKTDFDFFPADLAEKYVTDDRAVMASGVPKHVEEMYVDEHGQRHWMETWKAPVLVDGRAVGTVGFSRDITERLQAMEALLSATGKPEKDTASGA